MTRPLPSPLMVIADAGAGDPAAQAGEAARGGATFLEIRRVRPADGSPQSALRLDEIRRAIAAAPGACVLVNDRVDLAVLAGAGGAHVGQDDLPAVEARALLGPDRILGLSTHDAAQLAAAQGLPLDYVALGPIFESRTKSGHAPAVGLERLAALASRSRLPVVAIGGIDERRFPAVLDAGASCAAIASAISGGAGAGEAPDAAIAGRVERLLAIAAAHRALSRAPAGAELIALAGPPGSGKSTVGPLVASRLGLPFVDLDELVDAAPLLARVGEESFRFAEAAALRERLASREPQVVALGGGSLLGEWTRLILRQAGARVVALELGAEECARRLAAAPPLPLAAAARPLAAAARAAGAAALEEHLRIRQSAARDFPRALVVDAAGAPEGVAERVTAALTGDRPSDQ